MLRFSTINLKESIGFLRKQDKIIYKEEIILENEWKNNKNDAIHCQRDQVKKLNN